MTQQVNLLAHEERPPILTGLRAMIGAVVLIPPILLYGGYTWLATNRLATSVERNDAAISAEKAKQKALLQQIAGRPIPVNLGSEIEALKPVESQSQQVLNLLRQGGDKVGEGYAGQLAVLARVTEEGLWLTSVKITNGGKTINLAGNALQSEAVVRYAQRLNEQFEPQGVKFTALELTPELSNDAAVKKPLAVVAFKLN